METDNSSKDNSEEFSIFVEKNLDKLSRHQILTSSSLIDQLKSHGFAINRKKRMNIFQFYNSRMITHEMFITSDYIFYFLTQLSDLLLINIERKFIIPIFQKFTEGLLHSQRQLLKSKLTQEHQNLLLENIAMLTVVCKLQNHDFPVDSLVEIMVTEELNLIEEGTLAYSNIFHWKEDFSIYKVRGHYTFDATFQKFFKAMLYIQRMLFAFQGQEIKSQDKESLSHRAIILLLSFEDYDIYMDWNYIENFLSSWVGPADDLTIYEYLKLWYDCGSPNPFNLSSKALLDQLEPALKNLRNPKINDRLYDPSAPFALPVKGLRIFGQRYLLDSFIFQELTYPNVPDRAFPTALDWMAIFGSQQADQILKDDRNVSSVYIKKFQSLQPKILKNFKNLLPDYVEIPHHRRIRFERPKPKQKPKQRSNQKPNQRQKQRPNQRENQDSKYSQLNNSFHSNFLYCLQGFWEKNSYTLPGFMQSSLWDLKTLQCAAGAWAQERHSIVLYAKPTMSCLGTSDSCGYIEPQPEVYRRMIDILGILTENLGSTLPITRENDLTTEFDALSQTQTLLRHALLISLKELKKEVLLPADASFIRFFGSKTNHILKLLQSSQPPTPQPLAGNNTGKIVDVYTEYQSKQCLEVGVGMGQEIIVIVPDHSGELRFTYGGILPYYEFKQPIHARLTDSEWDLKENSFSVPIPSWLQPLYSTDQNEVYQHLSQRLKQEIQHLKNYGAALNLHKSEHYDKICELNKRIIKLLDENDINLALQLGVQRRNLVKAAITKLSNSEANYKRLAPILKKEILNQKNLDSVLRLNESSNYDQICEINEKILQLIDEKEYKAAFDLRKRRNILLEKAMKEKFTK